MKTKIVATIGPASSDRTVLKKMIEAGMDVCRLNFSHGSYEDHQKMINYVREINQERSLLTTLLADLQGPKIRLGDFSVDQIEVLADDKFLFTTNKILGTGKIIPIRYEAFAVDVSVGETILVDDGKMAFKVMSTNGKDEVQLTALNTGVLLPRKGVNLPDTVVSLPSLTEKDMADLQFILKQPIQWIALSFVRSANDIKQLRHHINQSQTGNKPLIMAKIEKPQAVDHIDEIIDAADGIMIARGDLGVELPMQMVPMVQKRIIRKCQTAGKPVVVATQMMEAMITNIRPTRAEVSDVANSVLDGADALMLSAETSVGLFPVETIATMKKIIRQIEDYEPVYYQHQAPETQHERFVSDAVLYHACEMARQTEAKAIAVVTHSGYSAFKLSSHRPKAKLLVFSNDQEILCKLNLLWGVHGFFDMGIDDAEHIMKHINKYLLDSDHVELNDLIINVLSTPLWEKGASNTLRLSIAGK